MHASCYLPPLPFPPPRRGEGIIDCWVESLTYKLLIFIFINPIYSLSDTLLFSNLQQLENNSII